MGRVWPLRHTAHGTRHTAHGFQLLLEESMSGIAWELLRVKLTIEAGLKHFRSGVVPVLTNNELSQAYIDHLGGRSMFLSNITEDLWSMYYQVHILLVAIRRPGKVSVACTGYLYGHTTTLTSTSRSSRLSAVGIGRTR